MSNEKVQLLTCKTKMHIVCGFAFHIEWTGNDGTDQHGAKWINVAENENSFLPEPVNPKYLDAYFDALNDLKKYLK